jgi:hypothetical protein
MAFWAAAQVRSNETARAVANAQIVGHLGPLFALQLSYDYLPN